MSAGFKRNQTIKESALTGSWLRAINLLIEKQEDIELAIAFYDRENNKPTVVGNTKYYPINDTFNNSKIKRLFNRYLHKILFEEDLQKYLEIINDFSPDVIHVHGSEAPFGIIAKHTNIPVVLSIQGNLTVYNWKYFSGINKDTVKNSISISERIFSTGYGNYHTIFDKKAKREQEILVNIKHIIGRTDWDRRISKILAPKSKYYYNEEVLREPFYNNVCTPKIGTEFVITTIMRPSTYKGLEVILKAAELLSLLNGQNFRWMIGGISKHDKIVKLSMQQAELTKLKDNISFLGIVNTNEIIDLFQKTNVYIVPSHIENSSILLSEAMISQLPVICTYAGGMTSRITDGKEGLVIQSGDPWSLAGAIIEIIEDYPQALQYGQNARKRALYRHNPKTIANDLLEIYKTILKTS